MAPEDVAHEQCLLHHCMHGEVPHLLRLHSVVLDTVFPVCEYVLFSLASDSSASQTQGSQIWNAEPLRQGMHMESSETLQVWPVQLLRQGSHIHTWGYR